MRLDSINLGDTVLEAWAIIKRFGVVLANDRVDFAIKAGEWNKRKVGNLNEKRKNILNRIGGVERARGRRDNQYLSQIEKELWKEYNKILAYEGVGVVPEIKT